MIAAVDIGGTKIAAGIVGAADGEERVLVWDQSPTDGRSRSPEAVAEDVLEQWEGLLARLGRKPQDLKGLGVAFPGKFETGSERILTAPNLPPFIGRRPRRLFQRAVEQRWGVALPVAADNDTCAAVLAEARYGAGQGAARLIYLTISTGFGGALLETGPPRVTNLEPGLSTFPDPGRPEMPLDLMSSGVGIAKEARAALLRLAEAEGEVAVQQRTRVLDVFSGSFAEKVQALEAPHISAAAAVGDGFCQEQMARAAHFAAEGIARLIEAHRPDRIVVGGGVALNAPGFLDDVRARLTARPAKTEAAFDPETQLVPAALGEERGILGAAAFLR